MTTASNSTTTSDKQSLPLDSPSNYGKAAAREKLSQEATDETSRLLTATKTDTSAPYVTDLRITGTGADTADSAIQQSADKSTATTDTSSQAEQQHKDQPVARPLDEKTLDKTVEELHEAINRRNESGLNQTSQALQGAWRFVSGSDERTDLNDPDKAKISALLEPLSQADRQAVEKLYHDKYDKDGGQDTLRRELQDKVGKNDDKSTGWRGMEAILNRADGRTNDAGALMVAIAETHNDKEKGNAQLRSVLQTLAAKAPEGSDFAGTLDQLDKDFQVQYGKSYKDALNDADLTDATKEALPLLEKGVDNRNADDVVKLAQIALQHKDTHLFGEALSGDNPATVEARNRLGDEQDFLNSVDEAFQGDDKDVAMDYVKEGRITLATVADKNLGNWIFDNRDNVSLAAENATEKEREQFKEGRRLADSNADQGSFTPEQKSAFDFYQKIDKAFQDATGEGRQISIWEDQLAYGRKTLITQLAETHHPGVSWDVAGLNLNAGRHRDTNEFFTVAENLGKEDWNLLHDPATRDQYRKELEKSLTTYVDDEGQRQRILELIDKKANAESYEAASKIHRSLEQAIDDNKDHIVGGSVIGIGTEYHGDNILRNLTDLSPEDAKKYHDDPNFRKKVDEFFASTNVNDTEKLYAHQTLQQVGATGQPPKLDAHLTFLRDAAISGDDQELVIRDAEALLADQSMRDRLNQPTDKLSAEDKQIKEIINNAVSAQYQEHGSDPSQAPEAAQQADPEVEKLSQTLFQSGKLSFDQKMTLGFNTESLIPEIADATPDERNQIMGKLSTEQQAIVKHAAANGGKMDLADRLRLYAIGDDGSYEDFKADLQQLDHQQIQGLKAQYSQLFNSSLDADFLGKVDEKDRETFTQLLTPSESDGRQAYYNNVNSVLDSLSGFNPDGSDLTLQRSLDQNRDLLSEFQRQFQTLPPEKQADANKHFTEALQSYQTSKEAFAEKLYQAAVIVGGVAVGVATGGVGFAALAAVAVVGAAGRVALKKVIQGEDYDLSLDTVLKDGAIGAATAGLSVVGPETIAALSFVGKRAVSSLGDDVVQGLNRGVLEREVNNLVSRSVVRGEPISNDAISQAISKAGAEGLNSTQRAAVETAIRESMGGVDDAVKTSLIGSLRQAAAYGTVGGTANLGIEGSVAAANGQDLNAQQLLTSFGLGFGAGAGISATFDSVVAAASRARPHQPTQVPADETVRFIDEAAVPNSQPSTDRATPSELFTKDGVRWARDEKSDDVWVNAQGERLRVNEVYPNGSMDMVAEAPDRLVGGIYNAKKGTFKEIPRLAGASQDDPSNFIGNPVSFQGNDWKIASYDRATDQYKLSTRGVKEANLQDLRRWNNGRWPERPGQSFNLLRGDGSLDSGWRFLGTTADERYQFYKDDAVTVWASKPDLHHENPNLEIYSPRSVGELAPEPEVLSRGTFVMSDGRRIDAVTANTLRGFGLTPESYVYRSMDPQYLDFENSTIGPNPKSCCSVKDPYNPDMIIETPDGPRPISIFDKDGIKVGPGLNVAARDPSGSYPGQVLIAIKVDDLLKAGGRVYPDSSSGAAIGPMYFTFDGKVPFTIIPRQANGDPPFLA